MASRHDECLALALWTYKAFVGIVQMPKELWKGGAKEVKSDQRDQPKAYLQTLEGCFCVKASMCLMV